MKHSVICYTAKELLANTVDTSRPSIFHLGAYFNRDLDAKYWMGKHIIPEPGEEKVRDFSSKRQPLGSNLRLE